MLGIFQDFNFNRLSKKLFIDITSKTTAQFIRVVI